MSNLSSCPKHNMVAYLEKTDGNAEFHEIIDFLTRSSIHHALTVSPVVSTTFVEQFWMSAKSKIINNVRHITAKVAGKPVSISKASIRSDLLFNDANGIDSLPNQAIFDAIQLMGHLDAKKKFVMYPRFISIFLDKQLANVPVPLDHFPVNALTKRQSEAQPTPSPTYTSEVPVEPHTHPSPRPSPSTTILDSIPESSGGNLGGHSSSDKSLSGNEGEMTLQSVYDLCLSLCAQSMDEDCLLEVNISKKEILKETMGAQRVCIQTREEVYQSTDKEVVSTDKEGVSTDKEKVSTDRPIVSTDGSKISTDEHIEGTEEHNEGTEEHIEGTEEHNEGTEEHIEDKVLLNMSQAKAVSREKEKGVELKDIEEADKPRPTSTRSLLTLKPLPKIDPKDKGKKKIEEEDESKSKFDGIPQAEKKFKSDEDFISIGSAEDERLIKRMNEKGVDSSKSEVLKEESKEEFPSRSDKENDELRLHLTIAPDEEKEVDYEILDRKYPIKEWKTVIFQDEIPEGFDRVLWGDLMVMFNPDDENDFWNAHQDWNIVSWKLHVFYQVLESEEDNTMAWSDSGLLRRYVTDCCPDQTVHALASPKANELTIPEQTATGKGTSNPLMAGSLPKTTKPT
ncbi:hypothetical protein Tco_0320532 [Tanacetum coccineum]